MRCAPTGAAMTSHLSERLSRERARTIEQIGELEELIGYAQSRG